MNTRTQLTHQQSLHKLPDIKSISIAHGEERFVPFGIEFATHVLALQAHALCRRVDPDLSPATGSQGKFGHSSFRVTISPHSLVMISMWTAISGGTCLVRFSQAQMFPWRRFLPVFPPILRAKDDWPPATLIALRSAVFDDITVNLLRW